MSDIPSIHKIEERCRVILGSPYLVRTLPEELANLRLLLKTVDQLTREDVPSLIAEVKRLRTLNKQLEAAAAQPEDDVAADLSADLVQSKPQSRG